jgi:ParB-like chromosome segregation protein Spo0J
MGQLSLRDTVSITIIKIVVGKRPRPLNQAKVDALVESIKAVGLQHPISVCLDGDVYHLVTGHHRLEAAKKLGCRTTEAVKITRANREIWEIDENLMRAELTTDEVRASLKRRKELWKKRQAEAKEEANSGAPCAINRGRGKPKGFAAETAAATGRSKSQINRFLAEPKVKAESKWSDKKRHRRTKAQIEREYLLGGYRNHLDAISQSAFTDEALDLLTEDKMVDLIEDGKKAKANIDSLLGRLRRRMVP